MFDYFKKIHQLKKMQDELKTEELTFEHQGISVTMNGAFEIKEIKLNSSLNIQDQQNILKYCLNKIREDLQEKIAQKIMTTEIKL